MLLTIDIGNTSIAMGLYENQRLERVARFEHNKNLNTYAITSVLESIYKNIYLQGGIISSVADELTGKIENAVTDVYKIKPLILNSNFEFDLNLKVKNPETIGSDRLANIYAASKLYKQTPLIIIDSGSATTFDILDKNGDFIGGVIMPGFTLQFKSLNDYTSKLPLINIENYNKGHKIICTNTKSQMISGVIRGQICAIEGLLKQCEQELGEKPFVVITGGGAKTVEKYIQKDFYNVINPDLTLQGLGMLYERNIN